MDLGNSSQFSFSSSFEYYRCMELLCMVWNWIEVCSMRGNKRGVKEECAF